MLIAKGRSVVLTCSSAVEICVIAAGLGPAPGTDALLLYWAPLWLYAGTVWDEGCRVAGCWGWLLRALVDSLENGS